jgi:mono/diheme cytochrome c family protein
MREALARLLALATGLVVLVAAVAFAGFQNAGTTTAVAAEPPPGAAEADPARIERGRAVYADAGCAGCHAIAGEGNPRNPLDGVGGRMTPEEIRQYTIADPAIADDLAPRVAAAKKEFQKLPADDLDALVAYLSSLE